MELNQDHSSCGGQIPILKKRGFIEMIVCTAKLKDGIQQETQPLSRIIKMEN